MLLGYLALSMIIALIVSGTAILGGASLIVAFVLYAVSGAFSVICFAAFVAFRQHDPIEDTVAEGLTPAE